MRVTIPHAAPWNPSLRDSFEETVGYPTFRAFGGRDVADENGPCVLYVEDEPAVLDLGVVALEEGGFRVVCATSGADALRELETPDAAFRALVTDIDLSSVITGWDVARRGREVFPDLAVIYVSGGSAHDWNSQGVPGSIMLTKPYALAQLVVAVSSATLGPQTDLTANS